MKLPENLYVKIAEATRNHKGIDAETFGAMMKSKDRRYSEARHIITHFLHHEHGVFIAAIARRMGRCHTSCRHSRKTATELLSYENDFKRDYEAIKRQVK